MGNNKGIFKWAQAQQQRLFSGMQDLLAGKDRVQVFFYYDSAGVVI
ncbi:hypothetical protein ABXS71_23775 [Bacillus infantis]